ncbi:hypothetical protein LINPERHAP1_LOCUS35172, partial [Linum perenne]
KFSWKKYQNFQNQKIKSLISISSSPLDTQAQASRSLQFHRTKDSMRPPKRPIHMLTTWVRRQPGKVKGFLAIEAGMAALVLRRFIVNDHDNLFVAAEAVHSFGEELCRLILFFDIVSSPFASMYSTSDIISEHIPWLALLLM